MVVLAAPVSPSPTSSRTRHSVVPGRPTPRPATRSSTRSDSPASPGRVPASRRCTSSSARRTGRRSSRSSPRRRSTPTASAATEAAGTISSARARGRTSSATSPCRRRRAPAVTAFVRRAIRGAVILVVATSLNSVDDTLHRLIVVEPIVTLAVLGGDRAARPLGHPGRIAAADRDRCDGGNDRRRRSLAPGRTRGRPHRGWTARARAERHARRSSRRSRHARHRSRSCGASSPTHRMSCARRWRPFARTPSSSRAAPTRPDDLERSMAGITRESKRMSLLVDDLLLLARLDEGRPLERGRALDDVVRSRSTPRAQSSRRAIAWTLDAVIVLGDGERLRQVVDNLFSNVRAHAPDAHRCGHARARDGVATIAVADSGPGLSTRRPSTSSSASTAPTRRARARPAASASASRSSLRS